MNVLVVAALALSLQGSAANTSLRALAGKWVTTVQPPPGEAPMIAPTFTIDVGSEKVTVTIQSEKGPYPATVFEGPKDQFLLVFKAPAGPAGNQTIIIRPIGEQQVRFETFIEYHQDRKVANVYYAEVFKKSR